MFPTTIPFIPISADPKIDSFSLEVLGEEGISGDHRDELLEKLDIDALVEDLKEKVTEATGQNKSRLIKRLEAVREIINMFLSGELQKIEALECDALPHWEAGDGKYIIQNRYAAIISPGTV